MVPHHHPGQNQPEGTKVPLNTHISAPAWWNLCSPDFQETLPGGLMSWSRKKCQRWFPLGKWRSAGRMMGLGKRQHSSNSLWEEKKESNPVNLHLDWGDYMKDIHVLSSIILLCLWPWSLSFYCEGLLQKATKLSLTFWKLHRCAY